MITSMIDGTFWFVQRHFIALIGVVTIIALAMVAGGLAEYAQYVVAIYFSALAGLIALRTGTGLAARIGFGLGGLLVVASVWVLLTA